MVFIAIAAEICITIKLLKECVSLVFVSIKCPIPGAFLFFYTYFLALPQKVTKRARTALIAPRSATGRTSPLEHSDNFYWYKGHIRLIIASSALVVLTIFTTVTTKKALNIL